MGRQRRGRLYAAGAPRRESESATGTATTIAAVAAATKLAGLLDCLPIFLLVVESSSAQHSGIPMGLEV
jgi:hypothetical protein